MGMAFGIPKLHLQRFRLAAGLVFEQRQALRKNTVGESVSIFDVITCSGKTNRQGTQIHAGKVSKFILNSHRDPIGDQNGVQYLSQCI